jgi:peptide/nickel transport system substrate-binding protein
MKVALAALAALAVLATGPAPARAQADTPRLRVATQFLSSIPAPDPRSQFHGWYTNFAGVSETLLGLDHDLRLVPRLAESFENRAPDTWVLKLRPGVLFHDGSALDGTAVKASFDAIGKTEATSNARLLRLLDLAEVTAEGMTVTFRTRRPNAAFPYALSEPSAAVVRPGTAAMPIIATGPFQFVSNEPNRRMVVRAFDRYWGGAPKTRELVIDGIPDAQTARLALEAGNVDLVINYPETDFARLVKSNTGQRFTAATTRLFFMAANTKSGPLADPRIREAVSLAIDRDVLVDVALGGVGGTRADNIFPATMAAWVNPAVKFPHDPARAKALLAAAGATVGSDGTLRLRGAPLVLKLGIYEGRAAFKPTSEIVQALLQAVGIKVEIRPGEYEANNAALKAGELDLHLQAWGTAPQGDPGYVPETLLKSDAGLNDGRYANPALDALMDKVRVEFDPAARRRMVFEIQAIIAEEMPLFPLFHSNQTSVGNGRVVGYRVHPAEAYMATPGIGLSR